MMSSTKKLLITAPNYDRMTRYFSVWAMKYAAEMEAHNHDVFVLKDEKVDRKSFESYITKHKPDIIYINGHGAHDRVAGQNHDIIADTDNPAIFNGANVYALSCQSANSLGKAAVAAGAKGYVGYNMDFVLCSQPSKTTHPEDDTTAALFLQPSIVIASALAKGHDATTAVKKGRQAYSESIRKALNSDVQSDDDKFVSLLIWNRAALTSC